LTSREIAVYHAIASRTGDARPAHDRPFVLEIAARARLRSAAARLWDLGIVTVAQPPRWYERLCRAVLARSGLKVATVVFGIQERRHDRALRNLLRRAVQVSRARGAARHGSDGRSTVDREVVSRSSTDEDTNRAHRRRMSLRRVEQAARAARPRVR